MNLSRISDGKIESVRTHLQMIKDGKLKALYIIFNKPFHLPVGDNRDVDFVKIEYNNGKFIYSYMSVNNDESSWQQGKLITSVEYDTINNVVAQLKMDKTEGNGFEISFNAKDSVNLKQNNMKRIKDNVLDLDEPVLLDNTENEDLYATHLMIDEVVENDYVWGSINIVQEVYPEGSEDEFIEPDTDTWQQGFTLDLTNNTIKFDGGTYFSEKAKQSIIDLILKNVGNASISDSRRVKDNWYDEYDDDEEGDDEKFEYHVSIFDSAEMSKEEGRKYEEELCALLSNKRYKNGDNWCETDWVEPMDRIAATDTVAVWGYCYADEIETVFEAIEMWTNDWANQYGFELRITPTEAID